MHKGPSLLRVFASRVHGSPNSETLPRIFSDPSIPSSMIITMMMIPLLLELPPQ
jgi:hypothetical protein